MSKITPDQRKRLRSLPKGSRELKDLKDRVTEAVKPIRRKTKRWYSPSQQTGYGGFQFMKVDTTIWRGQRSALGVSHAVLRGKDWEVHMMRTAALVLREVWHHYIGMIVWDDGRYYRKRYSCHCETPEAKALNEMFRERLQVTFKI